MPKQLITIVFPNYETAILGGLASISLTERQAEWLRLYQLGGIDAVPRGPGATRIVAALMAAELLDARGLTDFGQRVARAVVEESHARTVGAIA